MPPNIMNVDCLFAPYQQYIYEVFVLFFSLLNDCFLIFKVCLKVGERPILHVMIQNPRFFVKTFSWKKSPDYRFYNFLLLGFWI